MILIMAKIVLGYLMGSLSGSLLLGRLRGVDIRQQGSGNAGGTNAFRTQGWKFGLGVALIDVGKAALAVALAKRGLPDDGHTLQIALLTGAAAVAGHVWPLYYGFRGGKGVATLLGVLLVLWPVGLGVLLLVALLVLTTTGYVSLGSMLAGVALVPAAVWLTPAGDRGLWLGAAVVMAAFIIFTHRANLQRLRAGNENRFEKARVLARLFSR